MRTVLSCVSVGCLILPVLLVSAASEGKATQKIGVEPTVEEMLNAHALARGGAEAWRAVTSLVRRQTSQIVTIETTWARASAGRADRVRIDQSSDYRSGETRAFDGQTGWERGEDGPHELSSADVQELREDVAGMVELLAVKELGLQVAMAGGDSLDGKPVWKVAAKFRSGRKLTLWLDAKTWLEAGRSRLATAPDGTTVDVWTTLGDYRQINGLALPHSINGMAATYKVNVPIADDYFRLLQEALIRYGSWKMTPCRG